MSLRFWFWAGAFLCVFAGLAAWSWRKWPDILVDYGLQLYMPWQLSSGKVLGRDVVYLAGGPLSQSFHALMFKVFGVSFTTLIFTNLTLLALLICMLYRLFARAADHITGLTVCSVVLFGFAFSHCIWMGNYNYVCPYSYETVHGLILSVATIACLWLWTARGSRAWALCAGLCSGCVFLTKPDLFLALAVTLAAAILIHFLKPATVSSPRWEPLLLIFIGFTIPSAIFISYYSLVWETKEGFKAVAGAWLPVLTTPVAHNAFYQRRLGLNWPMLYLIQIARYSSCLFLAAGFFAVCAWRFKRRDLLASCLALAAVGLLYLAYDNPFWQNCGRALGPATFTGCAFVCWRWWRIRRSPEGDKFVFPMLWSVFALILLAKMGLATRIVHYGFYLAMPAAVSVVLFLMWLLPAELKRFDANPGIFRALVAVFLAVGLSRLVAVSNSFLEGKTVPVGSGGDMILTFASEENTVGNGIKSTVTWIRENTSPDETLAVLPEGVIVNYLSRRTNPTPYTVFCPPEVQAYGETNMLKAYRKNSPDYIVLIHRDASEYGVRYFGSEPGYGYDMMRWVRANYTPVWLYGCEPLKTNQFGIQILKRTSHRSSETARSE